LGAPDTTTEQPSTSETTASARSAFFERFGELESVWERELEPVVFGAVPSVAEVEALFREALEASG
jgi:uncharacterized protein (DUF2062 family)